MNTAVIINLIIQLVAGAAGGNGLGKMLQQFNLGPLGNTIAGAIGGLAGGSWLAPMITAAPAPSRRATAEWIFPRLPAAWSAAAWAARY